MKTNHNVSQSNRGKDDSMVDVNDIDISRHFGEGTVGVDGGIELSHPVDFLNRMDV